LEWPGRDRVALIRAIARACVATLALGTFAALALLLAMVGLTGWLRSLVFGVSPHDPASYLVVVTVLTATPALGCWIPARGASGVNPVDAIRAQG
jgi:putative ABC transport system permease protein